MSTRFVPEALYYVYWDGPIGGRNEVAKRTKREAMKLAKRRSLRSPLKFYVRHERTGFWASYVAGTGRVIVAAQKRKRS